MPASKRRRIDLMEAGPPEDSVGCDLGIDEFGDLTLVVGDSGKPVRLRASSKILGLASPVWNAMLYGGFQEQSATEIPLPDDNAGLLLVVLRIAHLKFNQVPYYLDSSTLQGLAVLCDKYDMVGLLRPFLHNWARLSLEYEHTHGWTLRTILALDGAENWLTIAWTFGLTEPFKAALENLVLNARIDESCQRPSTRTASQEQQYITVKGMRLAQRNYPANLIEHILSRRDAIIQELLDALFAIYESMVVGNRCTVAGRYREQCNASMLGSFVQRLNNLGLWPTWKASSDVHMSVLDLIDKFECFSKLEPLPDLLGDHTGCVVDLGLQDFADVILGAVPKQPLDDEHLQHLANQAKK